MFTHNSDEQWQIQKALGPGDAAEVLSSCFNIKLKWDDFRCLYDTNWSNDQVMQTVSLNFTLGHHCIYEIYFSRALFKSMMIVVPAAHSSTRSWPVRGATTV